MKFCYGGTTVRFFGVHVDNFSSAQYHWTTPPLHPCLVGLNLDESGRFLRDVLKLALILNLNISLTSEPKQDGGKECPDSHVTSDKNEATFTVRLYILLCLNVLRLIVLLLHRESRRIAQTFYSCESCRNTHSFPSSATAYSGVLQL